MTTPIEPNPSRWSPSTDPVSIIVPGLDTNAPINDQIDQIDQLITIKLQNIDSNFSRIQHLMATRLLPAVKRYALGTEPVREAAEFWTSFYEQAAQVHIPTLDAYDSLHDEQPQPSPEPLSVSQPEENSDVTPSPAPSETATRTYDVTVSESSFIPANAISSTPARPLENEPAFPSPHRPRYERTPRKPRAASPSTFVSTSVSSSALDIPSLTKHSSDSNQQPQFPAFNDTFDDSIDLMQGMSPPRTLAFARAPRSSVVLGLLSPIGRTPGKDPLHTLGRTPGKEAADRIRRDLLGDVQSQFDDTTSTIPSPPSLSRYTRHEHPSWTDGDNSLDDEPVHSDQHYTAFLMASSRETGPDDSFGSSNSNHSTDSLGADEFGGGDEAVVHPFARALEAGVADGNGFDDSFDSEGEYEGEAGVEETVFGIPPAQRGQQGTGLGLRLLGEGLLQDTIGIGGQLAKVGSVEESPTPYYGRDV